jgi:hypothetical protein
MDDKGFDRLARLIGSGASRRTILKGLLGLGGAVTLRAGPPQVDARDQGSRPDPPILDAPPATTTQAPVATTAAPDPCASFTTTCAMDGCCNGSCTAGGRCCPSGLSICGEDCCATAAQCCGGRALLCGRPRLYQRSRNPLLRCRADLLCDRRLLRAAQHLPGWPVYCPSNRTADHPTANDRAATHHDGNPNDDTGPIHDDPATGHSDRSPSHDPGPNHHGRTDDVNHGSPKNHHHSGTDDHPGTDHHVLEPTNPDHPGTDHDDGCTDHGTADDHLDFAHRCANHHDGLSGGHPHLRSHRAGRDLLLHAGALRHLLCRSAVRVLRHRYGSGRHPRVRHVRPLL